MLADAHISSLGYLWFNEAKIVALCNSFYKRRL